jgi:hypothetical protein
MRKMRRMRRIVRMDGKNGKNDKDGKKKDEDENRAGADVGKIVNLMSGDANR